MCFVSSFICFCFSCLSPGRPQTLVAEWLWCLTSRSLGEKSVIFARGGCSHCFPTAWTFGGLGFCHQRGRGHWDNETKLSSASVVLKYSSMKKTLCTISLVHICMCCTFLVVFVLLCKICFISEKYCPWRKWRQGNNSLESLAETQKAADMCYYFQGGGGNFFTMHGSDRNRNREHCAALTVSGLWL